MGEQELSFDACLKMMRKRDAWIAESGFHSLLPRAHEFVPELLVAFGQETHRGVRCWLLELIGEARSEAAFPLFCEYAFSSDESLSSWAIQGLKNLDTKAARTFLFEHGLKA